MRHLIIASIMLLSTVARADRPIVIENGKLQQLPSSTALQLEVLQVATSSNLASASASSLAVSGTATMNGGQLIVSTPTCTTSQVPVWSGTAWGCGSGGGGGGGITNSAGNNVIMKSNGTNAIASTITDDGNKVTFAKQIGLVSAVPFAYRQMQITMTDPAMEEGIWIEDNATSHVGSAGQNQAINLVLREQGTSDCTAAGCTATAIDAAVTQTRAAGSNALVNTAVLANASGGQTNYSWYSSNGLMVQTGDASFGNFSTSGTLSVGTTLTTGGVTTIGGNLNATGGTVTLGPSGASGKVHPVNGNFNIRSPDVDTYVEIKNNSTGGRDWYFESSGTSGTQPNTLNVYDNTAGRVDWYLDSSGNEVLTTGHRITKGTAPTLTSCGTSPSLTGTDSAGILTTGSAATTCTITFAGTFGTEPACTVVPMGTATMPVYTVSATAITITTDIASTKYHYSCPGL